MGPVFPGAEFGKHHKDLKYTDNEATPLSCSANKIKSRLLSVAAAPSK